MIDALCSSYGDQLTLDPPLYSFPTLPQLSAATEDELRTLGFGYRAKYICQATKTLEEKGAEDWLFQLRQTPNPDEVVVNLTMLPGVGMKVASCVALFSLDKVGVVPVDTHVWDIVRRFSPQLSEKKTITPAVHQQVGEFFREEFGEEAGWAHCILFAGELPALKKEMEGGSSKKPQKKKPKTPKSET
eukprot:CAMPEP_0201528168 /NCGR_PEP_ID=MMETSP0161_2-20130828/37507_1 /ASSEMBLY_ACC=CAM_ASM_000251 /TAXON_ID=180227 /ORGANISM="Neoparamoeba aestuarina, Strain SoJaBio B1-5/56/2" /LENGTH=187 /DNA_ID=CAMNT_0047929333 /DNA_START=138 /DNA_END=697 /DNA_ORIENTATION=+